MASANFAPPLTILINVSRSPSREREPQHYWLPEPLARDPHTDPQTSGYSRFLATKNLVRACINLHRPCAISVSLASSQELLSFGDALISLYADQTSLRYTARAQSTEASLI